MIKRLGLRNFRGVEKGIVELFPLTILLGGNNAGKSTVLEALFLAPNPIRDTLSAFYSRLAEADSLTKKRVSARPFDKLAEMHRSMGKGLLFLLPYYLPSEGVIFCEFEDRTSFLISFNELSFEGFRPDIKIESEEFLQLDIDSLTKKGELHPFSSSTLIGGEVILLSTELLKEALELLKSIWVKLVNTGATVRAARTISLLVQENYLDILREAWHNELPTFLAYLEDRRRVPLYDLGEGAQILISVLLLWEALKLEDKKVETLLWDDVEAHMNPRILSYLADWFLNLVENGTQIIISTHSLEAARIIAGLSEEIRENLARIVFLLIRNGELKSKALSLKEVEELWEAGVDVRTAEGFLI